MEGGRGLEVSDGGETHYLTSRSSPHQRNGAIIVHRSPFTKKTGFAGVATRACVDDMCLLVVPLSPSSSSLTHASDHSFNQSRAYQEMSYLGDKKRLPWSFARGLVLEL